MRVPPLDRQHALALLRGGKEGVVDSPLERAEQISRSVATNAHKWIFQHPSHEPLDPMSLPPCPEWVREIVDVTRTGNELRVHQQFMKRVPPGL